MGRDIGVQGLELKANVVLVSYIHVCLSFIHTLLSIQFEVMHLAGREHPLPFS